MKVLHNKICFRVELQGQGRTSDLLYVDILGKQTCYMKAPKCILHECWTVLFFYQQILDSLFEFVTDSNLTIRAFFQHGKRKIIKFDVFLFHVVYLYCLLLFNLPENYFNSFLCICDCNSHKH